jgi:hypothetical protein
MKIPGIVSALLVLWLAAGAAAGQEVFGRPIGEGDAPIDGAVVGGEAVGNAPIEGAVVGGEPVGNAPIDGAVVGGEAVGNAPIGGAPVGGAAVGEEEDDAAIGGAPLY